MDYTTKNSFLLGDLDGLATYISGKGKTAAVVTETIYPQATGEDGYWDVYAGAANDLIDARGTTYDAYLYGETGNDTIYGSTGNYNVIDGGDGADLIDARLTGTAVPGSWAEGQLYGGAGADTLYGGRGEDYINGGAGRDIIDGGDGSDRVVYDATDIRVEGDGGFDWIDASEAAATNVRSGKGVTIDLGSNRDIFFNFEAVVGSRFSDSLTGDNARNFFDGGPGSDVINAGGGEDYVVYDPNDTLVDGGFDEDWLDAEYSPVALNLDVMASTRFLNFESVEGTRFDDTILGSNGYNNFWGYDGDDFIDGRGGQDYIFPGDGNDTWVFDELDEVQEDFDWYSELGPYAGGIDTIDASAATGAVWIDMTTYAEYRGFDNILGSAFGDSLLGGYWDNVIEGGAGADTIDGGGYQESGPRIGDSASYAGSADPVAVDLGAGTATGGDAEGDLLLSIRNLLGSQWDDMLTGDLGANILEGGAGADALDGGGTTLVSDVDYASYAGSAAGVVASLADPSLNTGDAVGDSYIGITGLMGSSFDDVLMGDDQDNVIVDGMMTYPTWASNQAMWFGGGDDWIDGGAGNDSIHTGAGNDTVVYDAADGNGYVRDEGALDAYDYQFNTIDTVDASSATSGVVINLDLNYHGFERVVGSAFDDSLTGAGESDYFVGGAGADYIDGGWYGWDTASFKGSAEAVAVDLGAGTATGGDAAGDSFWSIECLVGSANDDTLAGDLYDNVIEGAAGADQLSGGDGYDTATYAGSAAGVTVDLGLGTGSGGDAQGDTLAAFESLVGSDFADTLTGDSGDNRIAGGGGADLMAGGSAGQDAYVYTSRSESVEGQMDVISGFEFGSSGGDIIDLAGVPYFEYYMYGAYATTPFAGYAELRATADEVVSDPWMDMFVGTDGTDTYVFIAAEDSDGPPPYSEGRVEMVIRLAGVNDLSAISYANFNNGGYVELYELMGT